MKIGITERGDASRDFSWVDQMNHVEGAILITKNITDDFIDAVLPYKDKVILHATVTGYGHTKLEPHVMAWQKSIRQIQRLIDSGFARDQIVLRIDPIIPTDKGLALFDKVFRAGYKIGVRRFKISVIDMYPHVRERFIAEKLPLPYGDNFTASTKQFAAVDRCVQRIQMLWPDIEIECCAEPQLQYPRKVGCVSNDDLEILGLKPQNDDNVGYQRKDCLCLSCKTELLNNKYQCSNKCLYCYWKSQTENNKQEVKG